MSNFSYKMHFLAEILQFYLHMCKKITTFAAQSCKVATLRDGKQRER